VKRLRIAIVVGRFPSLSTTFILDQIVGLLRLGHEVEVFAQPPDAMGPVHAAIERYGILDRTHYWFRGLRTLPDVTRRTASLLRRDPLGTALRLLTSLDPVRFGLRGTSGHLWCLASAMLARPRFDVVLCHFGEQGLRADLVRRIGAFDAPLVTIFHGYDMSRYVREHGSSVYAKLFEGGALMLPISDHWRTKLIELGCPSEKIRVHHMGVDCKAIPFRERRSSDHTPRILSVARLTEKKGIEYALKALGMLAQRGVAFEYDIIGQGPLRATLEGLAREVGLEGRVTFHGGQARERVSELRENAHILLAPSVTASDGDQEGIPVAIMEAMASGMPVISTIHTGIPELVVDGITGYLAKERDADGLAEAISRLLSERPRWPTMGREARRIVEERYDLGALHSELVALLAAAT
jgi:colanic acid/amylovoran biosynthesis glycosyltransferase